jgi:hypothetical protein
MMGAYFEDMQRLAEQAAHSDRLVAEMQRRMREAMFDAVEKTARLRRAERLLRAIRDSWSSYDSHVVNAGKLYDARSMIESYFREPPR